MALMVNKWALEDRASQLATRRLATPLASRLLAVSEDWAAFQADLEDLVAMACKVHQATFHLPATADPQCLACEVVKTHA